MYSVFSQTRLQLNSCVILPCHREPFDESLLWIPPVSLTHSNTSVGLVQSPFESMETPCVIRRSSMFHCSMSVILEECKHYCAIPVIALQAQ